MLIYIYYQFARRTINVESDTQLIKIIVIINVQNHRQQKK